MSTPASHSPNAGPVLIAFDVDGTLTASTGVDDACFVAAVRRVLGFTITDTDWGNYTHSTDQGLTLETCQRHLGRVPTPAEIADVKREFLRELAERLADSPHACAPIPGAAEFLACLRRSPRFRVGLASGAWQESAQLKLRCAGLNVDDFPATFSCTRPPPAGEPLLREEIITRTLTLLARQQLNAATGQFSAVYVGDGVWDARAARRLDIGFIGVRHDGIHHRLHGEGVARIIADYRQPEQVLAHLHAVAKPLTLAPTGQNGPPHADLPR